MAQTTQETAVIEETTTAGEESVLASLGLNPQLFAFQLFNFAIVFFILWFMILKSLTKKMDERKQMIDDSLEKAKQIEANVLMSQQRYQEKIDEGKVEANKIIEHSHEEAERLARSMKEKSKKEIELLVDQAKRNIAIERDEAFAAVKKEAGALVVAAVEKILGQAIDESTDKKIIQEAIQNIKKQKTS